MASPQNVELEAAKFLHKLIQDSKDEPAKLATKLYVILQHMKSSGKENSMPYQVISRAMETVINQNGLDIEALKSSRLPLTGGSQIGSSSQAVGGAKDSRGGFTESEAPKMEPFASGRPPTAPIGGTPDYYQGTAAQRSNQSFDQESPSSLDSRSANSQSQDRRDTANRDKQVNQKDGKKAMTKRKRGDTTSPVEMHVDSSSLVDPRNTGVSTRKGKMTKAELSDGVPAKSGEMADFNVGSSTTSADGHNISQIGRQNSGSEMTMLRHGVSPRDTGKSAVSAAASSAMPFKDNQLKQLRAQCLVFLAFRNGLPPKKLHLEVAFGTFSREDGGSKDPNDPKGKSQSFNEPGNTPGVIMPFGSSINLRQTDKNPSGSETLLKGTESPTMLDDKGNLHSDVQTPSDDMKHLAVKRDVERRIQERMGTQSSAATPYQQKDSSSTRGIVVGNSHLVDSDHGILNASRANQPSLVGQNNWTGFTGSNQASKGPPQVPTIQHELPMERRDSFPSQFQNVSNSGGSWNHNSVNHLTSYSLKEHWKPIPSIDSNPHGVTMMKDGNVLGKNVSAELGGNERLVSADLSSSKKLTMSERWIMDHQKKRRLVEQNWVQKQQKAKERMTTSFHKLKENVSSCEDISAKTKSVIELKKLQLLELQRRLRRDFLNDFSKPITTEMEHLKSIKKHRHGRRVKQLERYELKMKEERQKRIRERQKEFFSEIEVHKEKLDDVFKIKRERWKGINRYVKEFHKKKERIHREKYDRIQREKINLLKINDVEGYLRMVQDAKSDRVKQLLKATEKYLQKLGSRLQEAKAVAGRFGHDVDETGSTSFLENSETTLVDEDESDQAKHYMESNEKYYKMAHSIKESIAEQPSILQGGKLREYQMNGLRWLVSLYNNHLNGILADEMGLGKTVQVISLICYLMETKNDRGPFLVVVPSSVLPGWESEINFWAPSIHKIVYAGPPEERRRLFKEKIVHQKFNVLLTTYEYLMNKHDRPKLSKVHWHYIIIDEGHRIKNASCKLNADLKYYQSSHRLLLTGTPLQNNLEELWALLNFLLPNIFNSSEDFSQWFNKPFESTGDNSPDEALLSEEENLLIINRLHQVLRPFVLRRLKHKVENQLPSKIERLIRCEASSYQKLLMKRVEDNLGAMGTSKARSVHNSVMELRNICNHPYLSQLHTEEVDNYMPRHYLPPIIRHCGKLETLDRVLPKLKATDHRVLFFSTMTRLLDVMEEYLTSKQYRYLRLDGHTSGGDRGALIDLFNNPDSPYFIFLLSIRAGGVGVNLQAADTVILFDTDWNPQVDLQAQARAHRIGQKRDVLVLRFETVQTVEEQVRASAEHKLGVANQSITAGFFDNNTSAEDRREYLESLLRECKKEEAAPVLDDGALNDVLARSEAELDVFEAVDRKRKESEMATWKKLVLEHATDGSDFIPPLPSRLVTDEDLKQFNEAMKIYDDVVPKGKIDSNGVKRKRGAQGGLDTQHYGRGKRAREVRSYEEQWTEEEFEKMCQAETEAEMNNPTNTSSSVASAAIVTKPVDVPPVAPVLPPVAPTLPPVAPTLPSVAPILPSAESLPVQHVTEITPPAKRGRGRPKRIASSKSPAAIIPPGVVKVDMQLQKGNEPGHSKSSARDTVGHSAKVTGVGETMQQSTTGVTANVPSATPIPTIPFNSQSAAFPLSTSTGPTQQSNTEVAANALLATSMSSQTAAVSVPIQAKGQGRKTQSGREWPRRRGKKQDVISPPVPPGSVGPDIKVNEQLEDKLASPSSGQDIPQNVTVPSSASVHHPTTVPGSVSSNIGNDNLSVGAVLNSQPPLPLPSVTTLAQTVPSYPSAQMQSKGQIGKSQIGAGAPRRRGKKQATMSPPVQVVLGLQNMDQTSYLSTSSDIVGDKATGLKILQENSVHESKCIIKDQSPQSNQDLKSLQESDDLTKQAVISPSREDSTNNSPGQDLEEVKNADVHDSSVKINDSEVCPSKIDVGANSGKENLIVTTLAITEVTKDQYLDGKTHQTVVASKISPSVVNTPTNSSAGSVSTESISRSVDPVTAKILPSTASTVYPSTPGSQSNLSSYESLSAKRQGSKTQNRLEPSRRRGKTSAPVLPAASDALIDSAPVSSDKVAALGRTHNVNDVARAMKEVFSGTCLPKPKACDPVGSDYINTPFVQLTPKATVDTSGSQSLEDKACADIETAGAACHTGNVTVNVHEKLSEVASDMQNPEGKPSLDMPITGSLSLTPAIVKGNKQESDIASDKSIILCSEIETAGEASHTGNVVVTVHEKQSEVASDMHSPEGKQSLDAPTTGALSLTPALSVKGKKQESYIASDQNIVLSSDIETAGAAIDTGNVAANVHEKQSEVASDMSNAEGKSSLDRPTTGAPSLTPAMSVKGNDQESDIASDKNVIFENMTLPNVSKPEIVCYGEAKEKAEKTHNYIEKSTTKSESEALDISPLNDGQKIDGSSERLSTDSGSTELSIETAPHQIGSSVISALVEPLSMGDPILGSQPDSLEKCSRSYPIDIIGTGCTAIPSAPEIFSNNPESSQADICVQSLSSANEAPDITENTSTEKLEPSESSSSFACAADSSRLLGPSEIFSNQPKVIPPSPATDPHSTTLVVSCISESAEINSRSEADPSVKASCELSIEEDIVGYKISASVDCDTNNTEPPNLSLDPVSPPESSLKAPEPSMKHHSETAILPPSTLVEEKNRGSVPIDESMEKAVAKCSGLQEDAKVDKVETNDHKDSSTRGIYTSSSLDELKDSKIEQDDNHIFEVEEGTLKSSSPSVKMEEGIISSGNDCSEGHSMSPRVALCPEDSGELGVCQVDELITVPDTIQLSLSHSKEEENIGVSSDNKLVMSESQNETGGSDADQRNCSDSLQSGHLVTGSHLTEDAMLMKGTKLESEFSDQINATQVSEPLDDPERLTCKNMDVLPCSPVKEDNVDVLIPDEQEDPLIPERSCRGSTKDSIASPLPQEKSESSEAEMVPQINVSDCDMVEPRSTSKNMELPSSSMKEDRIDVSSERGILSNPLESPLAQEKSECSEAEMVPPIKASDCDTVDPGLTSKSMELASSSMMEEDKVDVSSESGIFSNPNASHLPQEKSECSEAEMAPQINASDSDIVDPGLISNRMELSSSSMVEEDKVDISSDKGILSNQLAAAKPEEKQMDDNKKSNPLEAVTGHQVEASRDISGSCGAEIANASQVPNSSASVEKEEDLSEKGIDGSPTRMEAGVGDGVHISSEKQVDDNKESNPLEAVTGHQIETSTNISESCAAEIANASQVPDSSASVEKVEHLSEKGIDGSASRTQAGVGDGVDIPSVCSSAAVSELVECLAEKDSIDNSEADVTKQKDQAAQEENAPKDKEQPE